MLRELEHGGVVIRDEAGLWRVAAEDAPELARHAARDGQRRAIWTRAQRQPASSRELLELIALLGRPATGQLLAAAAGRPAHDVLDDLAELRRAELVRSDARGFAAAHDLVGETVRERMDPARRARAHQAVARALTEAPAAAEELARHLAGAGQDTAAAQAYLAAARERLDRFADREAEQLAEEGLALRPQPAPLVSLLEARAEAKARRGDFAGAREDLRGALALSPAAPTRSRLFARLAALSAGAEDLVRAANLADMALAEAGEDAEARARALYVAALVDMNLERPERAQARFAEALALFSQQGDARGVADIMDARAMQQFMEGDLDGAVQAFDEVANLFADSGNLLRVVTPRSTRGHALAFTGKPHEGLADTETAVEIARSLGHVDGQAIALWHRAEVLVSCERAADAVASADAALAAARRAEHRGWTATGLLGRGLALRAAGDLAGAEAAYREALGISRGFPGFECWAHARLGSLLVARGALAEAAEQVDEALVTGPPFTQYEARLARCELAVARGEPRAAALIDEAAERALAGGHRMSLAALERLRAAV